MDTLLSPAEVARFRGSVHVGNLPYVRADGKYDNCKSELTKTM